MPVFDNQEEKARLIMEQAKDRENRGKAAQERELERQRTLEFIEEIEHPGRSNKEKKKAREEAKKAAAAARGPLPERPEMEWEVRTQEARDHMYAKKVKRFHETEAKEARLAAARARKQKREQEEREAAEIAKGGLKVWLNHKVGIRRIRILLICIFVVIGPLTYLTYDTITTKLYAAKLERENESFIEAYGWIKESDGSNGSKLLITAGSDTRETEAFDVSEEVDNAEVVPLCQNLPPYPLDTIGSVGGVIGNNTPTPVVCGGYNKRSDYLKSCFALINGHKWVKTDPLRSPRGGASSIVIGNSTLFVVGGRSDTWSEKYSKMTEFVTLNTSTTRGPDLPVPFYRACFVKLNATTAMIMGGLSAKKKMNKKTYFYSIPNKMWKPGPDIITTREGPACGVVDARASRKDPTPVPNVRYIVMAGGINAAKNYVKTVEIWRIGSGKFVKSDLMTAAEGSLGARMVESDFGTSLVYLTLPSANEGSSGMFRVTCLAPPSSTKSTSSSTTPTTSSPSSSENLNLANIETASSKSCNWTDIRQSLKVPRSFFVAMTIPDSLVECDEY